MNQPCLPVPRRRKRRSDDDGSGDNDADFQNVESMDAMEYLAAVVQQAKGLPDVFEAKAGQDDNNNNNSTSDTTKEHGSKSRRNHVPIEGSAASMSYLLSGRTAIVPPPSSGHLPNNTRVWVDGCLANFIELRQYMDKCSQAGVGGKGTVRIAVPPMKDRPGWHIFCVGQDEARGNDGGFFDDDDDDDDDDEGKDLDDIGNDNGESGTAMASPDAKTGNAVPAWRQGLPPNGHAPSVQLLSQLDQVMVRSVLSHLCYYVTEGWSAYSAQRHAWIYALLARIERPIHRDHMAMLYGTLKELTKARAGLDPSQREELARVNLLVVVIGLHFEQGGGYQNIMVPPS